MQKVGVLGAGQMGSGIAHVLAQQGFQVFLYDISAPQLEKAVTGLGKKTGQGFYRYT